MRQVGSVRGAHPGECWWFLVWAIVGGCLTISFVSVVGLFFLPVAALAGLRWRRASSATAPLGVISGAGVPLLLVAYLQRKGPGTVCWHTATASGCDDYLDPRPWLAIGLVLLLGGIGAFVAGRRVH